MKIKYLIPALLISIVFSSCGNDKKEETDHDEVTSSLTESPKTHLKLTGIWSYSAPNEQDVSDKLLTIQEDGAFLSVNYIKAGDASMNAKEHNFLGTYQDGVINLGDEQFGDIRYSENQDKLYFQGDMYENNPKAAIDTSIRSASNYARETKNEDPKSNTGIESVSNSFSEEEMEDDIDAVVAKIPEPTKKRSVHENLNLKSEEELNNLSLEELKIARNEIFAKKGYIFKEGGAMDQYFSAQPWYTPEHTNVDNLISQKEKAYLELMQQIEAKKSTFIITEDNLELRDAPTLDAVKITNLKLGDAVRYLHQKSDSKVEIEVNDAMVNNYLYKVETENGEIGWIHGCCFE